MSKSLPKNCTAGTAPRSQAQRSIGFRLLHMRALCSMLQECYLHWASLQGATIAVTASWQLGRHADLGECPSPNQHPPPDGISSERHPATVCAIINEQALFRRAALPFGIPMQPCICFLNPAPEQLPPPPPLPHVVVANTCALTCGTAEAARRSCGTTRLWVYRWTCNSCDHLPKLLNGR